jgi:hypothetical protein
VQLIRRQGFSVNISGDLIVALCSDGRSRSALASNSTMAALNRNRSISDLEALGLQTVTGARGQFRVAGDRWHIERESSRRVAVSRRTPRRAQRPHRRRAVV